MTLTAVRTFVVWCRLPPSERETIEEVRRQLGLKSWSAVLGEAWAHYKAHVFGDGKEDGKCLNN